MMNIENFSKAILPVLAILSTSAFAAPVDSQRALEIATSFRSTGKHGLRAPGVGIKNELVFTAQEAGSNCFYVINTPTAGYTIVSADDRLPEVLGYSTVGEFDPENVPCNMQWWLDNCRRQIANFIATAPQGMKVKFDVPNRMPIQPITKTTWNQSAPYNNVCPLDGSKKRSVTGCVATAMAQVMKHYEWPQRPHGTAFGFNFDGITIDLDWDNMLDNYDGTYTNDEALAVARLMLYCGKGVNMSYSSTASGAYSFNVGKTWVENFDYDATSLKYHLRDYYTQTEWDNLVYSELSLGRPIYYSGSSSQGGHAFVCDGYAGNGFFHFNWGWGGYEDGYFLLFSLNPGSGGIGSYEGGYNSGQAIYTGLIKKTDGPQYTQNLLVGSAGVNYGKVGSKNSMYWGEESSGNLVYNPTGYTSNLLLGLHFEDKEDPTKVYNYILLKDTIQLASLHGYSQLNFEIPAELPLGSYKMALAYCSVGTDEWEVVKCPQGTRQYIGVEHGDLNDKFYNEDVVPGGKLVPGRMIVAGETIYGQRPTVFEMDLTNVDENDDFDGTVYVQIAKANAPQNILKSYPYYLSIPGGFTRQINFAQVFDLDPGEYVISIRNNDNLVVENEYPVALVAGEPAPQINSGSVSAQNVTAGLVGINDQVTLSCTLVKNESAPATVSTQLAIHLYRLSDNEAFGALQLNPMSLTAEFTPINIGPFYVNSTIKTPGEYYWVISDIVNGERVAISDKWPFTVYYAGQTRDNLTYDVFRRDNVGYVELASPRFTRYEGNLNIPEKVGALTFERLGSTSLLFADQLESLSIPSTITDICGGQFYLATALKSLDIRANEPMFLSKHAFAPGAIDNISLTVNDGAANLFKRAPQWSLFNFGQWDITLPANTKVTSSLAIDNTTGLPYSPYYVSPEEQPQIMVELPADKCMYIKMTIDQDEREVYATQPFTLPALNGKSGKVIVSVIDIPSSVDEIFDTNEHLDVYTIDGRLVGRAMSRENINHLPKGVYVASNKKFMLK